MSVPGVFGHGLGMFRASVPYLSAEPGRVARWKSTLASLPGTKIGIAWQGNPTFPQDRERSIPLGHFLPLQKCLDVTLVSLQKGLGTEQLAANPDHCIVTLGDEFDAGGGAFLDTAAVMKNLDLVITSDTSIAHLAGALDVPVWVALPLAPHWRWMLHGERSPWYPSMRLFRQTSRSDWVEVFERIAGELITLRSR